MSNIYSQFPKEPRSPANEIATPRVDELDYNQEIKSYRIWDLARELEREVARLRELLENATDLIADIMWDEVNAIDECEKWLRAYAPDRLNRLATAPEEPASKDISYAFEDGVKATLVSEDNEVAKWMKEPAPEWRELGADEVIQEGDEVQPKHHSRDYEWIKVWNHEIGATPDDYESMRYRTRRPLPKPIEFEGFKKKEEMPMEKDQVIDYCRKWAAQHLADHGKETFYARLGLLVDFATDFYSDKIQKLKEAR